MCTGKQLQSGSACAGNQTEQILQQHHPELQISCYVMLSHCGRTLDSGCSLRLPAYLLVLFCNGFGKKIRHLVSSNARILKMHINGSLWDFIIIFNLMYVFEVTYRCVAGKVLILQFQFNLTVFGKTTGEKG
jgi:hypothetical protein